MRHKVIEMFGARVDWLLDAEAPSSTIEAILCTFGRSAPVVDTLMLIYPHTARERVARDLLDTHNKLHPPVAPAYIGKQRTKRIADFDTLAAHFGGTLPKYELERIRRWGDGVREIIYDHLDAPSDNYLQSQTCACSSNSCLATCAIPTRSTSRFHRRPPRTVWCALDGPS